MDNKKSIKPKKLPTEAVELYRRSRSLITARDLAEARKLLKQAVEIANKAGVPFPDAQNLLRNLGDALKAVEFKEKAYNKIDAQQWASAAEDLDSAINWNPIDEPSQIQTLRSHLESLLKAQNLISSLNAGGEKAKNRAADIKEIREIINITRGTIKLSKLRQEVIILFGAYNNKRLFYQVIILTVLCTSVLLLSGLWLVFLFPRNYAVIDCTSAIPDVVATLNYPAYIANGDNDRIEITFTNDGDEVIDGFVVFVFEGTAEVQLVKPTFTNLIEFKGLYPDEKNSAIIHFSLDEPFKVISDPGNYVDFSVCGVNGFHIAMSPIYSLRKLIISLWGTIGLALIGFFWDRIKEWLMLIFKRKSG